MATVAEVLAKASEWEAAGNAANAAKLRAYAKTLPPDAAPRDAASVLSKADEWDAAGQPDKAAKLRAYAGTLAPVAPSVAPNTDAATGIAMAQQPPRADAPASPVSLPRADTIGDTAGRMMEGPKAAMGAFGAGLMDTSKSPSRAYLANDPATGNLPGFALDVMGGLGDLGGAALSTVGAGLSGLIGLGTELVPGQDARAEGKLGNDLLGMSMFAVPELAGGSSVAARAASVAPKAIPKAVETSRQIAIAKPSVETLRGAKTAAYKAVDDAGEVFSADEMAALRDQVTADLDAGNYVSGVDKQTDAVLSLLERKSGEPMTLGQLDKLRQEFYTRLSVAPNEVGIEDAIDAIDNMIASNTATGELMQSARAANAKYKKVETLDLAFQKARDQTNSTGSSGNILNKYRQAVTAIVNAPKKAKWFSADELATMRAFIKGSKGENAARLIGKISPGGNGLMLALNLLASGATGGASLAVTAVGVGAKAFADSGATKGTTRLMNKVAGETPAPKPMRKPAEGDIIVGPVRDAAAPVGQAAATEAANSNRNPEYEALRGRYK